METLVVAINSVIRMFFFVLEVRNIFCHILEGGGKVICKSIPLIFLARL